MKRVFRLVHTQARQGAEQCVREAPDGWMVVVSEPNRTLEQNAAQWPILDAFAKQLQWPVDGEMVWMDSEEWKDVLTAAFHRDTVRLARGLDGGVVMLGSRTSKFPRGKFSDWLEFLHSVAAARGVEIDQREHAHG